MLADGIYERREKGHSTIVHCIEVKNGRVVRGWVYQVMGQYEEPGFHDTVVGSVASQVNFPGYLRQVR